VVELCGCVEDCVCVCIVSIIDRRMDLVLFAGERISAVLHDMLEDLLELVVFVRLELGGLWGFKKVGG
jgi:hypothetical protein